MANSDRICAGCTYWSHIKFECIQDQNHRCLHNVGVHKKMSDEDYKKYLQKAIEREKRIEEDEDIWKYLGYFFFCLSMFFLIFTITR